MRRFLALVALNFAMVGVGACGDESALEEESGAIPRETFIATTVDLRVAALRNEGVLDPRLRETVLVNHEVSASELETFAEVHGRDVAFMRDVWNEVERRLDSIRALGGGVP